MALYIKHIKDQEYRLNDKEGIPFVPFYIKMDAYVVCNIERKIRCLEFRSGTALLGYLISRPGKEDIVLFGDINLCDADLLKDKEVRKVDEDFVQSVLQAMG